MNKWMFSLVFVGAIGSMGLTAADQEPMPRPSNQSEVRAIVADFFEGVEDDAWLSQEVIEDGRTLPCLADLSTLLRVPEGDTLSEYITYAEGELIKKKLGFILLFAGEDVIKAQPLTASLFE